MAHARSTRVVGRYGKAHPQFPTQLKSLSEYFRAGAPLPTPPTAVNYYAEVKKWPMDGNDKYGDCTMAAAAHAIQQWNALTGRNDRVPSTLAVVHEYFKLSGGQDSGLVEADVLKAWNTTGLWGNYIYGYAPVNVHDQATLRQAIYMYGLTYAGIQVPANAETQFQNGQPWQLDPGWQQQQIVGGHAVPLVGYDDKYLYCVTWGEVQPIAYDWWQTYADEAWAVLPQEFKESAGFDAIDYGTLLADLQSV